ncbi:unnamed protein product [Urochloa humidicola]
MRCSIFTLRARLVLPFPARIGRRRVLRRPIRFGPGGENCASGGGAVEQRRRQPAWVEQGRAAAAAELAAGEEEQGRVETGMRCKSFFLGHRTHTPMGDGWGR